MASPRKKKAAQGTPAIGAADVPLCPYDVSEIVTMDRRELEDYPFNPRTISDAARAKLRKGIAKRKLLGLACVWNKQNRKLVGGHRRLEELDELMATNAYKLRVAVVDLDEKGHAEACILLNNFEAMGDWDLEKLGAMFKMPDKLEIEATGFDMADLYQIFGESPFAASHTGGEMQGLADQLREARERQEALASKMSKRDGDDFYSVFVFPSEEARTRFYEAFGFDDNRYQDGNRFRETFAEFQAWLAERAAETETEPTPDEG